MVAAWIYVSIALEILSSTLYLQQVRGWVGERRWDGLIPSLL